MQLRMKWMQLRIEGSRCRCRRSRCRCFEEGCKGVLAVFGREAYASLDIAQNAQKREEFDTVIGRLARRFVLVEGLVDPVSIHDWAVGRLFPHPIKESGQALIRYVDWSVRTEFIGRIVTEDAEFGSKQLVLRLKRLRSNVFVAEV